jgi:general secretion pathway protein K
MTMRRLPTRQRGVAVITALLLTTLAVAIVASLFWQQQVQVRTMENQRLQLQTKWIQRGALDWATLVLQGGMNPTYTSLSQPWATPLAETRLDQYIDRERIEGERYDATLSGNITDACARYNLINLASAAGDGGIDTEQLKLFGRLLTLLRIDPSLARRIADYVVRGQPVTAPPDAPDQNKPPPMMPAQVPGTPMPFLQVDDLLSVPGVTPAMVENLRPFVTVLPKATPVNVNTAPAEVLAALVEGMTVSEANALVVRRQQAEWRDMSYFNDAINNRAVAANAADVKSSWFLVNSRIRLDRAALDAEALVQRAAMLPAGGPKVWWIRQY